MAHSVDARGLSCPQPVLLTLSKIKEIAAGEIEVIVDNDVSRENVSRAARSQGWEVQDVKELAEEFHLFLTKT
jgi:tRNA 2-thiouridine synthesizing protein A